MGEPNADRPEARARQVTAHPYERRHPELHLMVVGMPRHANIADMDTKIAVQTALHPDALVGNRAVAFGPGQGLSQCRRRGENVVEQSDLPKVEPFGEVEAEKVVADGVRYKAQQRDLALDADAGVPILQTEERETCLVQKWLR